MTLQPIPGFQHFTTHHCVTGSLRHIYSFYGHPLSEELLLGLGAGVGFIYWHTKGSLPFLGGRANLERPGEEGLEKTIGRRTGVQVESFRTGSPAKAERILLELLAAEQPVMLVLDMGFLPYFDFGGEEYHFGYHVVVACGYDPQTCKVLVADRDKDLHAVPLEALARARGSKYRPFPPQHAWYRFDFRDRQPPEPDGIREAIYQCARGMLTPPIANLGVKGIYTAAGRIRQWPAEMDEKTLREACFNAGLMIDARGGTGGGLFRTMYGRFLSEAAVITGEAGLREASAEMQAAGDGWEQIARLFDRASQSPVPAEQLEIICRILPDLTGREEQVWSRLQGMVS